MQNSGKKGNVIECYFKFGGGREFLRISSQYNITALTWNNLERYQLEMVS